MLLFLQVASAQEGEWTAVPGYKAPMQLDSTQSFVVDSLEFEQRDAFADSKVYSPADAFVYDIGNKLHLETQESVVRKLLLFREGDSVTLSSLIESERLLRQQKFLADAKIQAYKNAQGKVILKVITSDKWTTTIPVSASKPGNKWVWSAGLLENNLLGLGQSIGFFYAQEENRTSKLLRYGNPHFLVPNHKILAEYAWTTDGYLAILSSANPFLSRSRNEWAYSFDASQSELDMVRYLSASNLPNQRTRVDSNYADALDYQPGSSANPVLAWKRVHTDSASLRIGRSMGSGIKWHFRGTYDYLNRTQYEETRLQKFADSSGYWYLDTAFANAAFPYEQNSRLGLHVTVSRVRYATLHNFHRIKWTEDVDKGWSLVGHVAKNYTTLGANDRNWFAYGASTLALGEGGGSHHFYLKSTIQGEWDEDDSRWENIYGRVQGEYIWKIGLRHSTVVNGLYDHWRRAPWGYQLSLGGLDGLNGLPSSLLVGQKRLYASLEQRWFPDWEFGTVVPVWAAFVQSGQLDPLPGRFGQDRTTLVGLGLRLGMSKSVEGIINQLNLAWPVEGEAERSWIPRFSLLATVSL